jgi:two-component system, sensor histidine kinase and response regulator
MASVTQTSGQTIDKTKQKPTILIVDDELINLENLRMSLRREYNIIMAECGEQALVQLKETHPITIIIADFNMPGMKGDVFLEHASLLQPSAVRMILSGHAHHKIEDMISSINRGKIFRYIQKPFQIEEVYEAIQSAVKYYHVQQQLSQTQEELVQAQKLALIGSFSGGIAHEVKNQLSGLSIAQLMQQKYPDQPDILRYADMILKTKDRILSIVEEIRDYVRNKQTDYSIQNWDLNQSVEDVLQILRFDTDLRDSEIKIENHQPVITKQNPEKIQQVLINLIRNAAHAMEGTPPEDNQITIRIWEEDSWGCVSITDRGVGIIEEHLQQIWEPFFTTKGKKGTGLGLELCKRIIEEGHHGTISVESRVDYGSTFTIRLPKAES